MQSNKLESSRSLSMFKKMRIRALELEYEEKERDERNETRINELSDKLTGSLSPDCRLMLTEYIDRLVAKYNTDGGYFYYKGFNDSRRIYSSSALIPKNSNCYIFKDII